MNLTPARGVKIIINMLITAMTMIRPKACFDYIYPVDWRGRISGIRGGFQESGAECASKKVPL